MSGMGKRNWNVNAFNFIVSCVIIPAAVRRRKHYFLVKNSTRGNFPSTLDSPTSTAGANLELGLSERTLLSEEFMEIATDSIKCGYNCPWPPSELKKNENEARGPHKPIVNNICVHRDYLCLASMSLLMPLRLWEGDLHWKCDGNQAVATVSVTVSDNTYCKTPVSHTQIVGPAWDTQPVICSILPDSLTEDKNWWRKGGFCERCHFSFLF